MHVYSLPQYDFHPVWTPSYNTIDVIDAMIVRRRSALSKRHFQQKATSWWNLLATMDTFIDLRIIFSRVHFSFKSLFLCAWLQLATMRILQLLLLYAACYCCYMRLASYMLLLYTNIAIVCCYGVTVQLELFHFHSYGNKHP